jgi:hypothetical protein
MSDPSFCPGDYGRFRKAVESMDEILERYHVTGEKSSIPRRALPRLHAVESPTWSSHHFVSG